MNFYAVVETTFDFKNNKNILRIYNSKDDIPNRECLQKEIGHIFFTIVSFRIENNLIVFDKKDIKSNEVKIEFEYKCFQCGVKEIKDESNKSNLIYTCVSNQGDYEFYCTECLLESDSKE